MTDGEISSLAKKYINECVAAGGSSPSNETYATAIAKVEEEACKLIAVSERRSVGRESVAC